MTYRVRHRVCDRVRVRVRFRFRFRVRAAHDVSHRVYVCVCMCVIFQVPSFISFFLELATTFVDGYLTGF